MDGNLLLALLASTFVVVSGDYILMMKLQTYKNLNHRDSVGKACERYGPQSSWRACDNIFTFCLREAGYPHKAVQSHCPLGKRTSKVLKEKDDIDLTSADTIDGNLPNPLQFKNSGQWPGTFQLAIGVVDNDPNKANDLVDKFFIEEHLSQNESVSSTYKGTYKSGATISLTLSVVCAKNYYSSDCSLLCAATDNSTGHYSCNGNGAKVCLEGYIDPGTNCVKRDPVYWCQSTCSPDGGSCDASGSCVCNEGWSGVNCDVAVCSPECIPGNGQCVSPNTCSCGPGWTGSLCGTCIPADGCSAYGGYCNNADECICKDGFTGDNCEMPTLCQSTCSPDGGSCDASGSCVCNEGWSGVNCDVGVCSPECVPGNGQCVAPNTCSCGPGWTGSLCDTCIPADGCSAYGGYCNNADECICKDGFTGDNCEIPTLCQSTCSPDGGSCDASGSCVCNEGWSGVNCDVGVCSPGCVPGNGQCVAPNTCSCGPGWTGSLCGTCISSPSDCSKQRTDKFVLKPTDGTIDTNKCAGSYNLSPTRLNGRWIWFNDARDRVMFFVLKNKNWVITSTERLVDVCLGLVTDGLCASAHGEHKPSYKSDWSPQFLVERLYPDCC